ncbi:MAG: hypothetical protein AB2L22_16205 [Syntrophales bacterium]
MIFPRRFSLSLCCIFSVAVVTWLFLCIPQVQAFSLEGALKKVIPPIKKSPAAQVQPSDRNASPTGGSAISSGIPVKGLAGEISPNLQFSVTKNLTTYEGSNMEFVPGDWVVGFTKSFDKQVAAENQDKDVTFIYEFHTDGKLLATHSFKRKFQLQGSYFQFNILPDPSSSVNKSLRWDWSGRFAVALSTLSAGKHPILVKGYIESNGKKTLVMLGTVTYNNTGGNGQMASYGPQIDKNASFDIEAENAKFKSKGEWEDFRLNVYNDCGVRVIIKFANKKSSDWTLSLSPLETKSITITDMESIYVKKPGRDFISGPSVSTFDKGKTIRLCR